MNHKRLFLAVFVTAASAFALTKAGGLPEPHGKVTPWAAMKTAAAKTGGKPFQALFEYEDGHWQYSVMVAKGGKLSEVEIDATTGAVGDVEGVTPDGEARELRSDLTRAAKGS